VSPARTTGRERGDQARFTRLAETAGPRVLAYLARRVDPPGDAADLLAEVLATAWRRVDDLPADDAVAVRDALSRLAPDDRELLTLIAWDGLRTDEAAVVLGISATAARQRLVRARRRLRAELDPATEATAGTMAGRPSPPRTPGRGRRPSGSRYLRRGIDGVSRS
jgi:DNA-directed RNA polymerase specialized sigma24 family protein